MNETAYSSQKGSYPLPDIPLFKEDDRVRFEYRCRRCHLNFSDCETDRHQADHILAIMLSSYSNEMACVHECPDGGVGIADLLGFAPVGITSNPLRTK